MQGTTGSEPIKCFENILGTSHGLTKVGVNDPYSNFSWISSNLSNFSTFQGLNYGACEYILVNFMGPLCTMIC